MRGTWILLLGLAGAVAGRHPPAAAAAASNLHRRSCRERPMLPADEPARHAHQSHFDDWTESMHARASDDRGSSSR